MVINCFQWWTVNFHTTSLPVEPMIKWIPRKTKWIADSKNPKEPDMQLDGALPWDDSVHSRHCKHTGILAGPCAIVHSLLDTACKQSCLAYCFHMEESGQQYILEDIHCCLNCVARARPFMHALLKIQRSRLRWLLIEGPLFRINRTCC